MSRLRADWVLWTLNALNDKHFCYAEFQQGNSTDLWILQSSLYCLLRLFSELLSKLRHSFVKEYSPVTSWHLKNSKRYKLLRNLFVTSHAILAHTTYVWDWITNSYSQFRHMFLEKQAYLTSSIFKSYRLFSESSSILMKKTYIFRLRLAHTVWKNRYQQTKSKY